MQQLEKSVAETHGFQTLSLEELDAAALLNRVDRKYVVPRGLLPALLHSLCDQYRMLEIDDHTTFTYRSTYFDTPDFQFYKDHHNGLENRVKVRCRQYVETGLCFFEIKRKHSGGRTDKYRVPIPNSLEALGADCYPAIRQRYPRRAIPTLGLALYNTFIRATLVSPDFSERVTIDTDLSFESPVGPSSSLEGLAILELKQGRINLQSPVVRWMREQHLPSTSISKYAFGMMSTRPGLKHNALKPILHRIQKIQSYTTLHA